MIILNDNEIRIIHVYTDGACKGINKDVRTSSIGVYFHSNILKDFSFGYFIGNKTNNEAEYLAVIHALKELIIYELTNYEILIHSDSMLVVEQLNGNWKINYEHLQTLNYMIKKLIEKFVKVTIIHVSRNNSLLENAHNLAQVVLKNELERMDMGFKKTQ